jgi:hypothetical protein
MAGQTPTIGRVVIFRDREGKDWPAMVTSVAVSKAPDTDRPQLNLQVFAEPAVLFRRNIPHTEPWGDGTEPTPGSWRWPERV